MQPRRLGAFDAGRGIEPPDTTCTCSECGYSHGNRKNFKRTEGGDFTCSTGHYEDKSGSLKRQKNTYARR